MSVIRPILFGCWFFVALFFADGFVLCVQAESTNVSVEQTARTSAWTHKEISANTLLKNMLYSIEKDIATTERKLCNYERIHATNIMIQTTSGLVSNRVDVLKLEMFRDVEALKLVERWEANPKEIDDRDVADVDVKHYDFVKRLRGDKKELRERLKNQDKYSAYKYQPYFHVPETIVFANSQECLPFVTSNVEEYRERIVPIILELNDSNSLSVLAGMVADDQNKTVRNSAAEAWVILSMPEGLASDQKKIWLDNFMASEKGRGKNGKKWVIEAVERLLRKSGKAGPISAETSKKTKNVRSE